MKSTVQRIREERAEIIMENELWDVINKYLQKPAAKCEAKMTLLSVVCVLASMINHIVHTLRGYGKD